MNLSGIIAISGKSGLYKVAGQSKSTVIVESLEDGKKFPAFATNKISALEDISIYTYEGDVLLADVYKSIFEKENGGTAPNHKDSIEDLKKYLREVLSDYDEERVFTSDIKKLFQWYNLLHSSGNLELKKEEKEAKKAKKKKETVTEEEVTTEEK